MPMKVGISLQMPLDLVENYNFLQRKESWGGVRKTVPLLGKLSFFSSESLTLYILYHVLRLSQSAEALRFLCIISSVCPRASGVSVLNACSKVVLLYFNIYLCSFEN